MPNLLKIKLILLAIQVIAFIVALSGLLIKLDGGWFCFNGIPVLISIMFGFGALIKVED